MAWVEATIGWSQGTAVPGSTPLLEGSIPSYPWPCHLLDFKPYHTYHVTMEKRFWSKVNVLSEDECWEWTAGRFDAGYGAFYINGQNRGAHRISFEIANGPIEDDIFICHICDNPPCVNPNHLFAGTPTDNVLDMIGKGRQVKYYSEQTHCIRGHKYEDGSYWIRVKKNGDESRVCKACDKIRGEKMRAKRRAETIDPVITYN
jgi:hypothetical protein